MLQFYKPNAKSTGCSCTFSFNFSDKVMFASMMRQHSWDSQKRRGSFKGNKDNPAAKASAKFSMSETSGIVDCIETNRELSSYHSFGNEITKIKFAPYIKNDEQLGFTLMVSKEAKDDSTNKRNFLIGFKFDEARLLKEYILKGLGQCFDFGSTKPAVKEAMPSFNAPSKEETNEDDLW